MDMVAILLTAMVVVTQEATAATHPVEHTVEVMAVEVLVEVLVEVTLTPPDQHTPFSLPSSRKSPSTPHSCLPVFFLSENKNRLPLLLKDEAYLLHLCNAINFSNTSSESSYISFSVIQCLEYHTIILINHHFKSGTFLQLIL